MNAKEKMELGITPQIDPPPLPPDRPPNLTINQPQPEAEHSYATMLIVNREEEMNKRTQTINIRNFISTIDVIKQINQQFSKLLTTNATIMEGVVKDLTNKKDINITYSSQTIHDVISKSGFKIYAEGAIITIPPKQLGRNLVLIDVPTIIRAEDIIHALNDSEVIGEVYHGEFSLIDKVKYGPYKFNAELLCHADNLPESVLISGMAVRLVDEEKPKKCDSCGRSGHTRNRCPAKLHENNIKRRDDLAIRINLRESTSSELNNKLMCMDNERVSLSEKLSTAATPEEESKTVEQLEALTSRMSNTRSTIRPNEEEEVRTMINEHDKLERYITNFRGRAEQRQIQLPTASLPLEKEPPAQPKHTDEQSNNQATERSRPWSDDNDEGNYLSDTTKRSRSLSNPRKPREKALSSADDTLIIDTGDDDPMGSGCTDKFCLVDRKKRSKTNDIRNERHGRNNERPGTSLRTTTITKN